MIFNDFTDAKQKTKMLTRANLSVVPQRAPRAPTARPVTVCVAVRTAAPATQGRVAVCAQLEFKACCVKMVGTHHTHTHTDALRNEKK